MKRKSSGTTDRKPTMAIIGGGNVGRVLALALDRAGYRVAEIGTREASQAKASAIARRVSAQVITLDPAAEFTADVVWICVTDDAIALVAKELARGRTVWRGKVALHTSGALSSKELARLRRKGAAVGSAHPMNSFIKTTKPDLRGVPFAVEGDAKAMRAASTAAKALGGEVFRIKAESKVLYHAMGAFASPLLVSLLNTGERVGRAAGLHEPGQVMQRILRVTIDNFLTSGSAGAFSGPILRGDVKTVRNHLKELRRTPEALEIYKVLARSAVKNLPGRQKAEMKKLLGLT